MGRGSPRRAYDPELFARDILPKLVPVKLMAIAEAAGCSKAYATDIRRGRFTPHASTWPALARLVGLATAELGSLQFSFLRSAGGVTPSA